MQIEVVWSHELDQNLFNVLASHKTWPELGKQEVDEDESVKLADCLREFKITETLDEDNKWYCSICKEHVLANKTMELYRTPPILIITLKRFKMGK